MFLFVGGEEKGYFINEALPEAKVEYTGYMGNIRGLIAYIGNKKFEHICINVEMFINSSEECVEVVKKVQHLTKANIIIFAQGYNIKTDIIVEFIESGFRSVILSPHLAGMKEQLLKCIKGDHKYLYEQKGMKVQEASKAIVNNITSNTNSTINNKKDFDKMKIAVCGSSIRIGTTTQALQLLIFILSKGFKACYIENNNSKFLKDYMKWTEKEAFKYNDVTDKITVNNGNMDLFLKDITMLYQTDYSYYIYDYGNGYDYEFDLEGFLNSDIKIVVGGVSAGEIEDTEKIRQFFSNDESFYYIYSFAPENARKVFGTVNMDKVFFSEYIPDPFDIRQENSAVFTGIMQGKWLADPNIQHVPKEEKIPKKKKIFRSLF